MLDVFALVVLAVLCAVAIWLVVSIGNLPGKLARESSHPQADAIRLLGWLGLLMGGIGWFLAMVWARMKPISAASSAGTRDLEARIYELEKKLQQAEGQA